MIAVHVALHAYADNVPPLTRRPLSVQMLSKDVWTSTNGVLTWFCNRIRELAVGPIARNTKYAVRIVLRTSPLRFEVHQPVAVVVGSGDTAATVVARLYGEEVSKLPKLPAKQHGAACGCPTCSERLRQDAARVRAHMERTVELAVERATHVALGGASTSAGAGTGAGAGAGAGTGAGAGRHWYVHFPGPAGATPEFMTPQDHPLGGGPWTAKRAAVEAQNIVNAELACRAAGASVMADLYVAALLGLAGGPFTSWDDGSLYLTDPFFKRFAKAAVIAFVAQLTAHTVETAAKVEAVSAHLRSVEDAVAQQQAAAARAGIPRWVRRWPGQMEYFISHPGLVTHPPAATAAAAAAAHPPAAAVAGHPVEKHTAAGHPVETSTAAGRRKGKSVVQRATTVDGVFGLLVQGPPPKPPGHPPPTRRAGEALHRLNRLAQRTRYYLQDPKRKPRTALLATIGTYNDIREATEAVRRLLDDDVLKGSMPAALIKLREEAADMNKLHNAAKSTRKNLDDKIAEAAAAAAEAAAVAATGTGADAGTGTAAETAGAIKCSRPRSRARVRRVHASRCVPVVGVRMSLVGQMSVSSTACTYVCMGRACARAHTLDLDAAFVGLRAACVRLRNYGSVWCAHECGRIAVERVRACVSR